MCSGRKGGWAAYCAPSQHSAGLSLMGTGHWAALCALLGAAQILQGQLSPALGQLHGCCFMRNYSGKAALFGGDYSKDLMGELGWKVGQAGLLLWTRLLPWGVGCQLPAAACASSGFPLKDFGYS